MSDEISAVGDVSSHVMEVNTVLVKNLVERFSEALARINSTLEAGATLDETVLAQLKQQVEIIQSIREDAATLLTSGQAANSALAELRDGLAPFFEDRPYHIEDRAQLIAFVRRFSSAISNWSDTEKTAMLDMVEKGPSIFIKVKTRLSRLYFILAAAGVTAFLTSIGAPEWIKKLLQLLTA